MENLLSPMLLAFALGVVAARLKSDLKFPEGFYTAMTMYLLAAIGMKGGYKLSATPLSEVALPAVTAFLISCLIPLWTFWILKRAGKFNTPNAAAMAAHYGSVSAVTFSAALAFHDSIHMDYEGFMPGLLAIMEIPAILIAIGLSRMASESSSNGVPIKDVLHELLFGKGTILLIGFLIIGFVSGHSGWEQVSPLFDGPFRGVLTLFLLEAGLVAGRNLNAEVTRKPFLVLFGIVMPVIHSLVGIYLGKLAGLSEGGATILGILSASASYIAAPAACRVALPDANPSYYLTAALAITFPFNLTIGIQLYHYLAHVIFTT